MILNNSRERKEYWLYLIQHYSTEQIEAALQTLPESAAQAVRLHHTEGLSLKEIAGQKPCSVSTVRHHYNLGMYKLSQHFGHSPRF